MEKISILFVSLILYTANFAHAFNAERDVNFLLNTRQNRDVSQILIFNDIASVRNSNFNAQLPTRILIHGFREDGGSDLNLEASKALLTNSDLNVIFVDWSAGAQTINYFAARGRIRDVARVTTLLINMLHENGMVVFNRLGLIGFSLGAHTVGLVGKQMTRGRINSILGLDPAGPLFDVNNVAERLDANDAEYVECIHTNGIGLVTGIAGIGHPICRANFYPNGGGGQPGCWTNTCSHMRAIAFYVESLSNNQFFARGCPNHNNLNKNACSITPGAWMGGEPSNFGRNVTGVYFLDTNNNSPFGRGTW